LIDVAKNQTKEASLLPNDVRTVFEFENEDSLVIGVRREEDVVYPYAIAKIWAWGEYKAQVRNGYSIKNPMPDAKDIAKELAETMLRRHRLNRKSTVIETLYSPSAQDVLGIEMGIFYKN
jgi:hypothetical protein